MRWIAALAASLIVVLSVSAAAAPLTPEATPAFREASTELSAPEFWLTLIVNNNC